MTGMREGTQATCLTLARDTHARHLPARNPVQPGLLADRPRVCDTLMRIRLRRSAYSLLCWLGVRVAT